MSAHEGGPSVWTWALGLLLLFLALTEVPCTASADTRRALISGDPHLTAVVDNGGTKKDEIHFDFHGQHDQTYCLISDLVLQVNIHLKGHELFEKATWIDATSVIFRDLKGVVRAATFQLDQVLARAGKHPFVTTYEGQVISLHSSQNMTSSWGNDDASLTIVTPKDEVNRLVVKIDGRLEMDITSDFEKDPPIYHMNFAVANIVTSPSAHGVIGQMYAPGAIQDRLALKDSTKYMEGKDEEYETSTLTATDCHYNRFRKDITVEKSSAVSARRLLVENPRTAAQAQCGLINGGNGLTLSCK